ncbi:hypothetical protein MNBD_GAMMA07-2642 [hydrothermal vent metagenome]|uniref:Tellurite resistance methyltransferase TehB-like domain-containing protein n=1 Tax=hydrothermal vent metagenome TaxID=652676 RepID=A0A3B0X1V6_9ZZZZ
MPNWDEVYTEKDISQATPADVLLVNEYLLTTNGQALDYASGLAGNGLYLEQRGYQVTAWDFSAVAVNKINQHAKENNLNIIAQQHDLENHIPPKRNQFDVVIVSYFLHRETLRHLMMFLKKDGLLFYQTFSGAQYQSQGPARESFRLKQNELLQVFSDMTLMYYREDDIHATGEAARPGQVYLVAKK